MNRRRTGIIMPKKPSREYNPPDHVLTDTEAVDFHLMYIRDHDQETVSGYLPDNMRIDKRGTIRYKMGQAPNTRKTLEKNHGRLKDNPQDRYHERKKQGQVVDSLNSNISKHKLKTLKKYYQEQLNTQGTVILGKNTITDKWGKLIPLIQIHMITSLIKRKDSYGLLNQIITDLRLNAGELPAQEIDVDLKQSHYHEFDLTELLGQAGKVLERHQVPQIADKKADNAVNADYEVLGNGTDNPKHKDLGQ